MRSTKPEMSFDPQDASPFEKNPQCFPTVTLSQDGLCQLVTLQQNHVFRAKTTCCSQGQRAEMKTAPSLVFVERLSLAGSRTQGNY